MENIYSYVAENVKRVQDEINEVCAKYGRNPEDVILMGVSKTQPVEKLEVAFNAGIKLFGENRVQELVQKADFFSSHNVPCHIIGTLQTNKVKYLPPLTDTIQSVNSLKLANEIEKQYGKAGKKANICLEINIGDEDSKSGIPYGQAMELVHQLSEYKNLTVKGLMCIPPIDATEEVRKYFAQMHKLFVDISSKKLDNIDMCILSMGMSGDYPWAIAEGSTLVRVGTGIFGQRNYNL
ncbi:MAG: YggS family pyridoxal phosphate-dependent enzyme [Oscillospiraceae bacterium]|nr:YggS family pyridoxal phosphate-dependent enzyme [Oscillospiraceae bacterium]